MVEKKHAYLIMAHNNFDQLKMLIDVLDNERTDLFIHIDKNSSFTDYDSIKIHAKKSYIEVFSEIKVYWSDYSQTECEVNLLKHATKRGEYEYYHLISNADFPVKTQEEILAFFDSNKGKEFVSFRFPMNVWPFKNKQYTTEHKYYHILTRHLRTGNVLVDKLSYFIEYLCVFLQFLIRVDRIKGAYIPCKGSNWWSITDSFARYILSKEDWIEKNFKYTRSSDEVFVSVLAYNSEFRERLYDSSYTCSCRANQRYIDWGRGFPYTFKAENYDEIISSNYPIIRKTDMNIDGGLVKKLYTRILKGVVRDV